MKRLLVLAFVVVAVGLALVAPAAAVSPRAGSASLSPVGGSGISGEATLHQLPGGGTAIRVTAFGLTPGHAYISLYYSTPDCSQPDFAHDQIGGDYAGNRGGVGRTSGEADDDLAAIHSVSVRDAATHKLLACGEVQAFG